MSRREAGAMSCAACGGREEVPADAGEGAGGTRGGGDGGGGDGGSGAGGGWAEGRGNVGGWATT